MRLALLPDTTGFNAADIALAMHCRYTNTEKGKASWELDCSCLSSPYPTMEQEKSLLLVAMMSASISSTSGPIKRARVSR